MSDQLLSISLKENYRFPFIITCGGLKLSKGEYRIAPPEFIAEAKRNPYLNTIEIDADQASYLDSIYNLNALPAQDVIKTVKAIKDLAILAVYKETESRGLNRQTVISAIDAQSDSLTKKAPKAVDTAGKDS